MVFLRPIFGGGSRRSEWFCVMREEEMEKKMNIEKQIELDKIKELWMELAVTEWAKEKIKDTSFFLSERTLRKQLRDTTDGKQLVEKLGTPPLQGVGEIKEIIEIAEKGGCLDPGQLEKTERALAAMRRLKDYLGRGKAYENPLAYYEENLNIPEELGEEIGRQIRNGMVDDRASGELERIRARIVKCEEDMKQKAGQVMRSHKEYMADHYCTFRNGRICVPVKKEYKLKIQGTVMDKSSTGNTLFMEPAGAAKYYEELQQLRIDEENEVYRILYTLTAMVAFAADVMKENIAWMEKLDFVFSKAKLSIDMDGTEPSVNTARKIVLKDARHPLMDRKVSVPLQFEVRGDVRGVVITGPNTGGKTVAIKTVMLNCMMAQCGLHVACREADVCMSSAYLCDIGDGQNMAENLSTFSAHIKNVLEVLAEIDESSFVIMDELGSGTDPTEGMGIAVAILEELRKSGALFLVTTHYPEVKEYADRTQGIQNAKMAFDKETLKPTYQMVIGEAGESCAFYIADRLGMPVEMLKVAAQAAYGEEEAMRYCFRKEDLPADEGKSLPCRSHGRILKQKEGKKRKDLGQKYKIGDSVMVYPDRKIGIVCEPVNEKGILRVQLPGKKIWTNHKRVKLHVAAAELYPEDYDFSIVFDTVENRKIRHDMERKYTKETIQHEEARG